MTHIYTVTTQVMETKRINRESVVVNATDEQSIYATLEAAKEFGRIKAAQRAKIYHETRGAFDKGESDSYFNYCVWVESHELGDDSKFRFCDIEARDITGAGYLV